MTDTTARKKKLIEVALPLDEINAACHADKGRKVGTLRNLHKWFAPMPLPAWRALLFAALVDDPGDDNQRVYLLDLMKRLVGDGAELPDRTLLREARGILERQFPNGTPVVMDPFCGGGSTLVEAQRLGLETFGSDLNPVPALITRILTELAPKVYGLPPINHSGDALIEPDEGGYAGFQTDVREYASRVEARARGVLGSHYPSREGEQIILWLWGRTATCVNPACGIETILTTTWELSKKQGDRAWIEPSVVDGKVHLAVRSNQRAGHAPTAPKNARGASFECIACRQTLTDDDLTRIAADGGLRDRLMAIHAEAGGRRYFREPSTIEIAAAENVPPAHGLPNVPLGDANRYVTPPRFGMTTYDDLFNPRQQLALATFADMVAGTHDEILSDGGSAESARAVASMLGLAVGKMAQYNSTLTFMRTHNGPSAATAAFGRADIPMTWDYSETNPFGGVIGSWDTLVENMLRAVRFMPHGTGRVVRADARVTDPGRPALIATDPPYFDAIGYADLSDFFYGWHRRALRGVHPDLYATMAAPRGGELTAFPWHHGGTADLARRAFIDGFTETFLNLQSKAMPGLPILVVYASKEQKGGREEETRWSSILASILSADLEITGTWPIRGTTAARMRSAGSNAVASYIVMVCRPRQDDAGTCSLSDFVRSLRRELGPAVRDLQAASILPVDLAQAAMGPGMQIFSRYRAVLDQSGNRVQVEQALRLINSALSEVLDEQEGELDAPSRFAVRWWESHAWEAGLFGEADKAVRPLGISVDDVRRAQVALSHANRVKLLGRDELNRDWTPEADNSPTAWEAVHHLADRLIDGGGELEAAKLMARLGSLQDSAMALTYRLHDIAAKKGRTADQERYNALINSWAELVRLSGDSAATMEGLF